MLSSKQGRRMVRRSAQVAALSLAVVGVIEVPSADAATRTWDGDQNNSWTQKKNWSSDTIPLTTDDVVFTATGAGTLNNVPGTTADVVNATFSGGTYDVSGLDATGTMLISGGTIGAGTYSAGTLNVTSGGITSGTFTVNSDYTATFGTGNSFVSKGGSTGVNVATVINNRGSANQTLSGTGLTNGATNTAALQLNAVRIGGSTSSSFAINYGADATSPTLRGAIKTNNLVGTDFSLTGITSSSGASFSLANAGVSNRTANFTATSAGAKTSSVTIVNNFDDVRDQTLNLNINVYRAATASVTPTVNFGVVHKGDVVAVQSVSVQNTGLNDNFTDDVVANFSGAGTGIVTSGGPTAALSTGAPGAISTALKVGIDTSSAAVIGGNATVALTSKGRTGTSGLADVALTSQNVAVSATVNDYAKPVFQSVSILDGDGSFTPLNANTFNLDLGVVAQGGGDLDAVVKLLNDIVGPADTLGGTWNVAGASAFNLTGFTAFSGIAAGGEVNPLDIELDDAVAGVYNGQIVLSHYGQNINGTYGTQVSGNIVINLTGEITAVPEPGTFMLLGMGAVGLLARRRRRVD